MVLWPLREAFGSNFSGQQETKVVAAAFLEGRRREGEMRWEGQGPCHRGP